MKKIWKIGLVGLAFLMFAAAGFLSAEEDHDFIIANYAESEFVENKELALKEIDRAINENNLSPAMTRVLETLACPPEGEKRRGSFPEIRSKACRLLGKVQTKEAKFALMNVLSEENEPVVIMEAIKALGNYGSLMVENDVVNSIYNTQRRIKTNGVALETLNALEKLLPSTTDKQRISETVSLIFAYPGYVSKVRKRAQLLLKEVSGSNN